jgi:3-oxoacyl-[acyl-carrier-protein] synthase-3
MTELTRQLMERNSLTKEDVQFVVPHQANLRIIEAVSKRLDLDESQVLVNIENVGNTSGASIPICLCDYEDRLKKGDNVILTAFGAGFTFGSMFLKWGYDGKQRVEEVKQNS